MSLPDWSGIAVDLEARSGVRLQVASVRSEASGCINEGFRCGSSDGEVFIKLNSVKHLEMFAAEAAGLAEIAGTGTLRVPAPLAAGSSGEYAYLAMEYLELGRGLPDTPRRLGERLAEMHSHRWDRFGWHRDNTIGTTLQRNDPDDIWVRFFRDQRLGYQLELAAEGGFDDLAEPGAELMEKLPLFFTRHSPEPSLLHGDLWGGNHDAMPGGDPVVFDPAVYYGDREADLAMTQLFGGFAPSFYEAYHHVWPVEADYEVRAELYNLYHVLNHANLFGLGYAKQARGMMERLLEELG